MTDPTPTASIPSAGPNGAAIRYVEEADDEFWDPEVVVLTCANCGAAMDERKCKLICRCGYFLSCSDYY
jgi:hypothetical protein